MVSRARRCGLPAIVLMGFFACAVSAKEVDISWDEVPDVVKATIMKHAKGAKILEVERETRRGGRVTYEAEFMLDGQMVEINVNSDGSLRSIRYGDDDEDEGMEGEEIDYLHMPAAVKETVAKLTEQDRIEKILRRKERTGYAFLVTWKREDKRHGARITDQGVIAERRDYLGESEVPAFIKAASLQAFQKDTETRFVRRQLVIYEVEADINGKTRRVLIAPEGNLVGRR